MSAPLTTFDSHTCTTIGHELECWLEKKQLHTSAEVAFLLDAAHSAALRFERPERLFRLMRRFAVVCALVKYEDEIEPCVDCACTRYCRYDRVSALQMRILEKIAAYEDEEVKP